MLCVRKMMALGAAALLVGIVGCGANRVETMKIEPSSLTLHTKDPVSPFTVTAYNAKGEVLPAPALVWSSSDSLIVRVDQTGRVSPQKSGTATVTVTSGNAKVDVPVTVTLYTSIAIDDTAVTLAVQEARQLTAQILDENGTPVVGVVTWDSMDKTIADVSAEGLVTGIAVGQTTISASVQGIVSAQVPVTVVAPPKGKGR